MTQAEVDTYELQLRQVEAALTLDPDNVELNKLKEDLSQVIDLTKELIATQGDESGSSSGGRKRTFHESNDGPDGQVAKKWRVGDPCLAIWQKDGQYYNAVIDEISSNGHVSVTFSNYGSTELTTLEQLKLPGQILTNSASLTSASSIASKREMLAKQKEYLKKRKQKKYDRQKKMEEEREGEKNKWQNFSNKAFGKKGFVKKSIFKTPENAGGRVGIGTCGVSGKEMTTFSSGPKHRKGF